MNSIKDYSFLFLEEIPLCELSQGLEEIISDYRQEENLSMDEVLEILENEFSEEITKWIQTNQELFDLLKEE
jgi:hypothetical protein